jgi:hypothetical protein
MWLRGTLTVIHTHQQLFPRDVSIPFAITFWQGAANPRALHGWKDRELESTLGPHLGRPHIQYVGR